VEVVVSGTLVGLGSSGAGGVKGLAGGTSEVAGPVGSDEAGEAMEGGVGGVVTGEVVVAPGATGGAVGVAAGAADWLAGVIVSRSKLVSILPGAAGTGLLFTSSMLKKLFTN